MIHIFSDASAQKKICAGAYIIGTGPAIPVMLGSKHSMHGELEVAALALQKARELHETAPLTLHTDLVDLEAVLERKTAPGSSQLAIVIAETGAVFVTDANKHPQHRECHWAARSVLGLDGVVYGQERGHKQVLKPETLVGIGAILDILTDDPMPEPAVAEASGLGFSRCHKLLLIALRRRWVTLDRPNDALKQCDLENWLWARRRVGQTSEPQDQPNGEGDEQYRGPSGLEKQDLTSPNGKGPEISVGIDPDDIICPTGRNK